MLVLLPHGVCGATDVVLVTDNNHPPYAFLDHEKPSGLYVQIVERITSAMPQYRVTLAPLPWKRALMQSEQGEAFGIFPPHSFPGQRPYLDKFSAPLFEETPVVVCSRHALKRARIDPATARWPDDFSGLSFGLSAGVRMGGDRFWAAVDEKRIKVREVQGIRENLHKILIGRIDCHINDRLTIGIVWRALARSRPAPEADLLVEVAAMPPESGYLALSGPAGAKFPFRQAFLDGFNAELEKLRRSGELKKMSDAYLRDFDSALIR